MSPKSCPFCTLPKERICLETPATLTFLDGHPVTERHTLVIPRRRVESLLDVPESELPSLWAEVAKARALLIETYHSEGVNVGVNDGPAAGQPIAHAHLHVIPRRKGNAGQNLGCLDDAGLAEMRRGKAATVMKGPYKGDQISVDHIIPRALVPELDNVIANLELIPLRMNEKKNAAIGDRQRDMAKMFYQAGLLSRKGLEAVLRWCAALHGTGEITARAQAVCRKPLRSD